MQTPDSNVQISFTFLNPFTILSTHPFGDIGAFKLVGLVGFDSEPRNSLAKSLKIVNLETDLVSTSLGTSLTDFLGDFDFVKAKIGDGVDKDLEGL